MPDIGTIAAAITSLKNAADIAKFLKDSDVSLERAEWKFKLADLMGALAEVKMQLADVQDIISQKDSRIQELEAAFESKDTLVRHRDAYYAKTPAGAPIGSPLCLRCWEVEHRKVTLVRSSKSHSIRVCAKCKSEYEGRSTSEMAEQNA